MTSEHSEKHKKHDFSAAGMEAARRERRKRPSHVMEVVATERLSDHFQRVTLGGAGFDQFYEMYNGSTDAYIKFLLSPDPAVKLDPPFDLNELREKLPREQLPVRRTYTVHSVDPETKTFKVDFVVHGTEGVAAPWSTSVQVGEKVQFGGPGGKYSPSPEAAWQLWVGDEAALPAIYAALAELAETNPEAKGVALIEVAGPEDEWELVHPAGVEVRWLHRGGEFTPETSQLERAVRGVEWPVPAEQVDAFVHGEREVMKALRSYLMDEKGLERTQLSLSAYWAYGRAEDAFQAEKREKIGQIYPEDQAQY